MQSSFFSSLAVSKTNHYNALTLTSVINCSMVSFGVLYTFILSHRVKDSPSLEHSGKS